MIVSCRGIKYGVEKLGKRIQYIAPEVLEGKPANKSSDVFCFGIILWSLVTRQTSWSTMSSGHLVDEMQRGLRPRITHTAQIGEQQLPPEYWDLAQKCWSPHCEERPSMNAVRASVEEMIRKHSDRDSEVSQAGGRILSKRSGIMSTRGNNLWSDILRKTDFKHLYAVHCNRFPLFSALLSSDCNYN